MSIPHVYVYGQDSIDRGGLFADGRRLAVSNGLMAYQFDAFTIEELCIEHHIDGSVRLQLKVQCDQRHAHPVSPRAMRRLFRSAGDLNIGELLALINERMDQRSEEEYP